MKIKPENLVKHLQNPEHRELILETMSMVLEADLKYQKNGVAFSSESIVRNYLTNKLANSDVELFAVLYLDSQHRLIEYRHEFTGTINSANVYPRNIMKSAIELNASAVIFSHNHPSGNLKVSKSDQHITRKLTEVLTHIDVRVLDHIIVTKNGTHSMAQFGEM